MRAKKSGSATIDALTKEIDDKIGEVRTDSFDMTFGEVVNLKNSDEIIINPDFQRLFRWSDEQKSRLIESIELAREICTAG
jgi:uncharacterized protein with ParB-like and HNH nuclease domain